VLLASGALHAADPFRYLPRGFAAGSMATGPDGAVYIGGALGDDAAILRVTDTTTPILYRSAFPSGGTARINALAVTAAGVYAAGTRFPSTYGNARAFALALDATGAQRYLTTLGGDSVSYAVGIAVNARGEAVVGGQTVDNDGGRFPTTPGAVGGVEDANTGFLVRLDATGKVATAVRGFGQGPVAIDAAGDLYVASSVYGGSLAATTPGAFQTAHLQQACAGTGWVGIGCSYQHVAKISADGTRLLYATFVAGAYGATPSAIAVNAAGEALLAGSTYSRDYPVTEGALQTEYRATAHRPYESIGPHPPIIPPPSTGYLTRLNANGTGLVWSTFFSGTGAETISALATDAGGRIVVAGASASRDLPLAQSVPEGCAPGLAKTLPFVAVLEPEARALIASRYVYGLDAGASPSLALTADGAPLLAAQDALAAVDLAAPTPLACATDPADNARLTRAAPEQLVTIFGDDFGEEPTVAIDGAPPLVLYRSPGQINLQIPAAAGALDTVTLTVTGKGGALKRPLRIVPSQPAGFLIPRDPDLRSSGQSCHGAGYSPAAEALARNQDGSWNSCDNPAEPGSSVTFFLAGLGAAFAPATLSLRYPDPATIEAVEPDAPGVWRMRIRLKPNASSGAIAPLVDLTPVRNPWLMVWVRQ
jgi:uncharacterized protein (TIGR03437 family)